jgi:Transposase IS4
LVQDFIDNFNDHREAFYDPSWLICADESISRWYGLGGNWINMGLPHYVAMDRKPEHGCEIQNSCDGMSGIMLRLRLVKSQAMEAQNAEQRMMAAETEAK